MFSAEARTCPCHPLESLACLCLRVKAPTARIFRQVEGIAGAATGNGAVLFLVVATGLHARCNMYISSQRVHMEPTRGVWCATGPLPSNEPSRSNLAWILPLAAKLAKVTVMSV